MKHSYWKETLPWYPDGCFGPYRSAKLGYSRRELAADFSVHIFGMCAGSVGVVLLSIRALMSSEVSAQLCAGILLYAASLQSMLCCSAVFNMKVGSWPHRLWALQLADHTGILFLIAGSYTPFMLAFDRPRILGFVWSVGLFSFVAKATSSPLDVVPVHVACFLAMGWAMVAIWDDFVQYSTAWSFPLIVFGGVLYTIGLAPWACSFLEFHNAIWHIFVLAASAVFFVVIYSEVAVPSEWSLALSGQGSPVAASASANAV